MSIALWGQTYGYGGDFNPDSPDNPEEPSVTYKYDLKLTTDGGGNVNSSPSGTQFVAGTEIYLNANPNTGYKFRCWMQGDSVISVSQWHYYTMPAKDVEIRAIFAFEPEVPDNPNAVALKYRVTVEASPSNAGYVNCNSEKVSVGDYAYVSASCNSGYQFKGWMLDGKKVSESSYYNFPMESRNMHFIALFEFNPDAPGNPSNNPTNEQTYTIKYTIDGLVCHTEALPAGAAITAIAEPTKKGHSFSGWQNLPTLMPASDLVVTGTFTPNTYHITYKIEGIVFHDEDVVYGSVLTPPSVEGKEGHTLTWTNLPSAMPDYDVVVEGVYTLNKYKLTYIVDGEVYKSYDVLYASVITPETSPTKEGYTFSGWKDVPETMPANDVVVTGSYNVNKYLITFKIGDEVIASDSLAYGSAIVAPEAPAKEGHTFGGWKDVPETMPAKDVVVTGSYTVNKYLITFKIEDEVIASDSLAYGSAIVPPEAPVKEGHTFSGWKDVPETMPANDVVVAGSFSVNNYTVKYMLDGVEFKTESVAYGSNIPHPEVPAKEGHTFGGWIDAPKTMPANDIVVTGSYNVNKYLITFKIGDEVIASDSLAYGSVIVAPEAPEREGHTFIGWGEVLQYVPAHDVTFVGCYTVNIYKVYYYVGEELVHTEEVAYGAAMPSYEYEPSNGDIFNGWEGEHYETMPAHDVTYVANITSSISMLQVAGRNMVVYDFNGRRIYDLNTLKSGLYIVNGKRMLVK